MEPPMVKQESRQDIFSSPSAKRAYNQILFAKLANRYDRVNRFLSLGCDQRWKKRLIAALPEKPVTDILDIGCGTGDLTERLVQKYPGAQVTGLDLCQDMLDLSRRRISAENATFLCRDMLETGVQTESIDVVTAGYALRNAPDVYLALKEIHRVLRPGGTLAMLEFSRSSKSWISSLQCTVLWLWGGGWGLLLQRNPAAYQYIARSLQHFPDHTHLIAILENLGFKITLDHSIGFGFASIMIINKL